MGKIEDLRKSLEAISNDARRTAQELEGLSGKLKKTQGTAREVGSNLGRSLEQSLTEAERTTKAAGQSLNDLSRKAKQQAAQLP